MASEDTLVGLFLGSGTHSKSLTKIGKLTFANLKKLSQQYENHPNKQGLALELGKAFYDPLLAIKADAKEGKDLKKYKAIIGDATADDLLETETEASSTADAEENKAMLQEYTETSIGSLIEDVKSYLKKNDEWVKAINEGRLKLPKPEARMLDIPKYYGDFAGVEKIKAGMQELRTKTKAKPRMKVFSKVYETATDFTNSYYSIKKPEKQKSVSFFKAGNTWGAFIV